MAVQANQKDAVKYRLENAANVNVRGLLGDTPLYRSVQQANRIILRILLDKGADPAMETWFGTSPLEEATNEGFREIAALLEEQIKGDTISKSPNEPAWSQQGNICLRIQRWMRPGRDTYGEFRWPCYLPESLC